MSISGSSSSKSAAKVVRGPRYIRVFPDTYLRHGQELDLRLRSLAAYRYVEGRGVLSGHSAAVLLGADCAPKDAPAEVIVPGGGQREHPGLLVHRGALAADDVRPCRGVLVTSGLRTGYDLGRRPGLVDAVVGIDALANVCRFDPTDILALSDRRPSARGCRDLRRAVALADRRAGSPMETRLRLILVSGGLPAPEVQYPVLDDVRRRAVIHPREQRERPRRGRTGPWCSTRGERATDRRDDLVRFGVHLVLREPVDPPSRVGQPRVAARVEEHALGAGVVGTLVLDADALCRVGEIQPHGAPPDVV